MPQAQPPAVAGRYRIGDVIGRGGRATVYEANDPLLGRKVALKLFTATATTPDEVRLQEAEARLVAGLDHFALTTLFDAGVDTSDPDGPRIFLVMERVAGGDLRRRLREGPLTAGQVATLGSDLAQGLDAVHEAGFLHRDIKPANVLLLRRGPSSRIRGKLTDFGIATIIGAAGDAEYTTGTAAYLSPEQVLGQDPAPAWDVYALGLVLLEALTGTVAYPGGVDESALARLKQDPEVPDSVPAVLGDVLRAMTARDPADRPTAAEASVALQEAFVDGLVQSRRLDPEVLGDDEGERLAAVRRVGVLDTRTDDAIERIVRLARRLLDVPLVLVSIVDGDREWFLSHGDLDVAQVPRNASFAAETVSSGEGWTTADLTEDPRADGHPLLAADGDLRAYAAQPLTTFDGQTVGAIVALDRRVREFTEAELADLADLAAVTMRELDLRLLGRRVLFDR
ncbi:GAF domain-containing serine/threonine-protein kinase [Amnibacterium kyonggiense]|uniref:non-specific serine/threonine protein kinase n=1 Tax=Amnibacterium kyonggiense TaxID=595671 RepID=A0A4R7FPE8_9MICO|nr:GAF domain-containing serine/threonine-protein kinase [Amnibacterium kyonggiense]TDS79627.1 serine/threonine protein kinase [Amnibacterium kyonggiense]